LLVFPALKNPNTTHTYVHHTPVGVCPRDDIGGGIVCSKCSKFAEVYSGTLCESCVGADVDVVSVPRGVTSVKTLNVAMVCVLLKHVKERLVVLVYGRESECALSVVEVAALGVFTRVFPATPHGVREFSDNAGLPAVVVGTAKQMNGMRVQPVGVDVHVAVRVGESPIHKCARNLHTNYTLPFAQINC
jgi:hypothetical protein